MSSLSGKRVLITGAAGGIGMCTAREFAQAGCELILTDVNAETLAEAEKALSSIAPKVHTRVVDVSSREQVEEMARWVINDLGGLDVLINNAGLGHHGEMSNTTIGEWEHLIAVNLLGPLYHIYAFMPHMIADREGHIVNVSSGQAFFRLPTWGVYASIKLALGALSEILHFELKRYNVKVTTVYPFLVNTPFYRNIEGDTFMGKLSLRLMPYYSMSPESVGRIIFKAVEEQKMVEMVSRINEMGRMIRIFPLLTRVIAEVSIRFLAAGQSELEDLPDLKQSGIEERIRKAVKMFAERRVGFLLDELMVGEHEFEPGCGEAGRHPMHYRVTWGPRQLTEWINPFNESFMCQPLEGRVTVGGLCEDAPCKGTLELKYFSEGKIRYTFDFAAKGSHYRYVGEKVNIRPWNLPVSHTTCFGTLTDLDSGKLVSRSVTYFRLRTMPDFVASFRLA